jgi:hypothetical protein
MLRSILLCVILSISTIAFSQAYKDSVKVQFLRYTDLLIKKKFTQSADYMNPGFFKLIPKDQLTAALEQVFNNPEMDFKMEQPQIISVGDNKVINNQNYVKLKYSHYLSMHFKEKQDTAKMKKAFGEQFGKENVTYNAATDTYKFFIVKDVIANSANQRKWTFVVVEEKQKPMLEQFIPKELL